MVCQKIKSPKTQHSIRVNRGEYKKLIKEGYTENELLYGKLDVYPIIPEEIVNIITKDVYLPNKRLINKQHLYYPEYSVPELPKELIDEITKDVNLPIKRLINKQYNKEKKLEFNNIILQKIYNIAVKNADFSYSDYGNYYNEEEFKEYQWDQISKLTEEDILFLNMLMKNIKKKNLNFTDDEYSHMSTIRGFFFDEGEIVFKN